MRNVRSKLLGEVGKTRSSAREGMENCGLGCKELVDEKQRGEKLLEEGNLLPLVTPCPAFASAASNLCELSVLSLISSVHLPPPLWGHHWVPLDMKRELTIP